MLLVSLFVYIPSLLAFFLVVKSFLDFKQLFIIDTKYSILLCGPMEMEIFRDISNVARKQARRLFLGLSLIPMCVTKLSLSSCFVLMISYFSFCDFGIARPVMVTLVCNFGIVTSILRPVLVSCWYNW